MAGVRMWGECALVVWFLGLRGRGLCLDSAEGLWIHLRIINSSYEKQTRDCVFDLIVYSGNELEYWWAVGLT
jgi:hypothetical protein